MPQPKGYAAEGAGQHRPAGHNSGQIDRGGVYEAGGIPLELPVVSLGETLLRPTAMLWRNMAAMATEEMLRANPIDGVVLLGGCGRDMIDRVCDGVPGARQRVDGF